MPEVRSFREQCEAICETLRLTANARAVVLAAKNGAVVVQVGALDVAAIWGATVRDRRHEDVWEIGDNLVFHSANVRGARLVVVFEREKSSLGLVRLRTRRAVEELERLFAIAEGTPGTPPPSGRGGPSGLPAEVRVALPKKKP